nr:hypothetical protein GCM10020063_082110 [Dactylosporangium thailandense]
MSGCVDYLPRPEGRVVKVGVMSTTETTSSSSVDVDLVEVDEEISHDERERRRKRAYRVEVRTPAGFTAGFRVHSGERVETLARHAERHFVARGELAPGNYRLELLSGGTTVPLTASATLEESGIVAGSVCVLVIADPQVDG